MKHKLGIKWRLILYLSLFTIFIIILLWFFQTVFLDDFYRTIKANELEKSTQTVAETESDDYQSILSKLSKNNICSMIISDDLKLLASEHSGGVCLIHSLPQSYLIDLYNLTVENGGEYSALYLSSDEPWNDFKENSEEKIERPRISIPFNNNFNVSIGGSDYRFNFNHGNSNNDSMIYCTISKNSDDENIFIVLSTIITPVDATVQTLRIQLILITIGLLILSCIMGIFISKRISIPIVALNEESKKLASGNFKLKKRKSNYKEIDELGETLQFASDEISKVDSLRRELISNVSHDLRTPLTLISGYGEVMRDIPGEATAENMQIVIDEANRLSALVTDLLDISKIESGMQKLSKKSFNFTKLIESIQKRYKTLIDKDGYTINFEYDDEVYIEADESKLSQVIYNLVNNAINYTGDDKLVLIKQTTFSDSVKLEVIDHGIGIEKDKLPYIWERYYKIDGNHKRDTIGSGLGLSIVKKLLELHDARYGVESTIGHGSCFWFEIKTIPNNKFTVQEGDNDGHP